MSLCQRKNLDELALKEFYSLVMDQLDLSDCTDGDNNTPLMLLCRHNTNSSQLVEVANVLLQTRGIELNDRNSKEGQQGERGSFGTVCYQGTLNGKLDVAIKQVEKAKTKIAESDFLLQY